MGVKTTVITTRTSLKIFLFLVFNLLSSTVGQNCGVPSLINVKQRDELTETLDTGQLLTKIVASNVKEIQDVLENPDNFAQVSLEEEGDVPYLYLRVHFPLWNRKSETPKKSLIDSTRKESVEVKLSLACIDGNMKNITFSIPIIDENTEKPRFEKEVYYLETEPCFTGSCIMLFDNDIILVDEDRDEKNALFHVDSDMDGIEIDADFSTVEHWYDVEDQSSHYKYRKGYKKHLRLRYTPMHDNWMPTCTINFTLKAWNQQKLVRGEDFKAKTEVHVTFQERPGRIMSPVFSNSYYYAFVNESSERLQVHPEGIRAYVPWTDSGSSITYSIKDNQEVILIDPEKGYVNFTGNYEELMNTRARTMISFQNLAMPFTIAAFRKREIDGEVHVAVAFVPFTIFLYRSGDNSTTTRPPTDTTPWPGTCPTPICPDPGPCPSTTTRPPIVTTPIDLLPILPSDPPTTNTPEPEIPPSTDAPEIPPSTDAPEIPPTTDAPEIPPTTPDSEESDDPTTSKQPTFPSTTTDKEDTTTETSSDIPTTSSTTETASTTSYTSPSDPVPSTTQQSTSTSEPPTQEPPTKPPGECVCDCDEFTCGKPQTEPSLNSTDNSYYPDPFECTRYHTCPLGEDSEGGMESFMCPNGTVFCPTNAHCTTVEDCLRITRGLVYPFNIVDLGYGDIDLSNEETDNCNRSCECRVGIPPESPRNLCNDETYEKQPLADPEHCDIFHKCQHTENPGEYVDYPMKCRSGLIFCSYYSTCVRFDEPFCKCDKSKTLRQCDTCIMGKWPGFDLFEKRFTH